MSVLTAVVTRLSSKACKTSGCWIAAHNVAGGSRIKRAANGMPRNRKKQPARKPTSSLAGQRVNRLRMLSIYRNEVVLLQNILSSRRENKIYKSLRIRSMGGTFDNGDRILGSYIIGIRDGNELQLVSNSRRHIRSLNEAGIGLTQRHFLDNRLHVCLLGDDICQRSIPKSPAIIGGFRHVRQHLPRIITRRNSFSLDIDLDAFPGQVFERIDIARIAGRNNHYQPVLDEDLRSVDQPRITGLLHVVKVRGGKNIGGRSVGYLLLQNLRTVEVELNYDVGMLLVIGIGHFGK